MPGQKDTFYVAYSAVGDLPGHPRQALGIDIFEIRFLEANIWLSAKRFDKADRIYKELESKVKPADAGLFWFYWAQAALGRHDYENYLGRLQKAIVTEPGTYKPMLAEAFVTVANRYHQEGERQSTSSISPRRSARTRSPRGCISRLATPTGSKTSATTRIEQYKLVLELEPDHPDRVRLLNRIRGQDA